MTLFVYGSHPVSEALRRLPKSVKFLYLRGDHDRHVEEIVLANSLGIAIKRLSVNDFDFRCIKSHGDPSFSPDTPSHDKRPNHQGIAVELEGFPYRGLSDILDATRDTPHAMLMILDGIEDPQNLGAIIRSAAAQGAAAVVIGKHRAASITPQVIRSSAGLAFAVPVIRVTNIVHTIKELAENGWWSVAAMMQARPTYELNLSRKIAFVVGSEGKGVRRLVAKTCDMSASIPMNPDIESMNVSVAAAILMYEWRRQTMAKN